MGAERKALNHEERSLLESIGRRRLPGPVIRSPARQRLYRVGLIEALPRYYRDGQAADWVLTDEGRAYLAQHPHP